MSQDKGTFYEMKKRFMETIKFLWRLNEEMAHLALVLRICEIRETCMPSVWYFLGRSGGNELCDANFGDFVCYLYSEVIYGACV